MCRLISKTISSSSCKLLLFDMELINLLGFGSEGKLLVVFVLLVFPSRVVFVFVGAQGSSCRACVWGAETPLRQRRTHTS